MVLIIILVVLLALIAFILYNTIKFKPYPEEDKEYHPVEIDKDAAVASLAELIKCKTVSYYDPELEDDAEFEKLINKIPELFPRVSKATTLQRFDGRGLLFHWKGKDNGEGEPAVFMAHYDVVPVEEDSWSVPAFEGMIKEDVMWGRGALDTKLTFNGILAAAENLLKIDFVPQHDIYFAFSGGEEIGGIGASKIVEYFQSQNITPAFVIDEGGAVVEDIFPGVKGQCGLIGIAEKGLMNVQFKVKSSGGHASAPAPHTPVGVLAKACTKIEEHPFKMHMEGPASLMFDILARRSTFVYRMIFSNLWLFGPVIDNLCKKKGGDLNALVRTTCAFTQMRGSKAPNVVPPVATMTANLRLNPSDTDYEALNYLRKVIDNPSIELEVLEGYNPSRISTIDSEGYRRIKAAIEDTWIGASVAPYLMVQCSDSRHYGVISDRVYRFSAMDVTAEERRTIHGNDEHVRISTVHRATEFFYRCMERC